MSAGLVLAAVALLGLSGFPGLFLGRRSSLGERMATALVVVGAILGIGGAFLSFLPEYAGEVVIPWHVPGGELTDADASYGLAIGVDGLSVIFLMPIFVVGGLGPVYGLDYWRQAEHAGNGRKLRLCWGLKIAAMALLVVARHSMLFLVAWEVMALATYFLVTTEDTDPAVCEAGWLYLVATHIATLCLFALFALLRQAADTFRLVPIAEGAISPGTAAAVFLLALVGFGIKAGIMPLHVWLPSSHAAAPSHVSALMSGVLLKMGIYGLVRVLSLLPAAPLWWGGLLLTLGVISGILGVAFAVGQHDIKRLLAYHSIENIGIIVMGLGLAVLGRSLGRTDWIVLGLAGGLLHVWNHALFKALLFLSAGSVIHCTHTRDIDELGGLAKAMPVTAFCFIAGAVAICGLPPLNGFVSEFLIYLGLFHDLTGPGQSLVGAALAAPALSLIGALALACFVKVSSAVFLGSARSEHAAGAHEAGPAMTGPMIVLTGCCLFIGLLPQVIAPVLDRAILAWAPGQTGAADLLVQQAPLQMVSLAGFVLVGSLTGGGVLLWSRLRQGGTDSAGTWDCGYAAPTPRIQYTSSSFAEMLVGLFAWALRPKAHVPRVQNLFPKETYFHSEVHDTVLDEAVRPAFLGVAWLFSWFRWVQHGGVHSYLLYIFVILVVLLLWR
jgi:hydrogenase-4 component B